MLENSRDCPLVKSKIDDFASKIIEIFQQSAKKSFKSYSVLSKKLKIRNHGLVCSSRKLGKNIRLHERIIIFKIVSF